jgi:ribosomal-protein-alanine N-acetyltransferase
MIETERLVLRAWRDSDVAPFAAMGRDPEVMKYFPALATDEDTAAIIGRVRAHFDREGWGLWAVEVRGGPAFVGFCGLQRVPFDAPFTPAIEAGWRLARGAWGHGYATEGAQAALAFARDTLHLPDIVSMVIPDNTPSRRVCERLGMTTDPKDDFDHPRFTVDQRGVGGLPVCRHVLFRKRF